MSTPTTFLDGRVALWLGDVRAALAAMAPDSVDCVVTSPPYWGLRDYGVSGQIGLEPTLGEHLAVMVEVFDLVRRVLKPSGTLWINYGDCYATTPNGRSAAAVKALGSDDRTFRDKPISTIGGALKPKDLCMVPNRLAIALQEAGWWVRSEIVWAKPNPMPESIRDRPATAHEKIFMLSRSERYWYDAEAVRQQRVSTGDYKTPDGWDTGPGGHGSVHRQGRQKGESVADKRLKQDATAAASPSPARSRRVAGFNERWDATQKVRASDVAAPRHAGGINHTGIEDVPRGSRNLRNCEPAPVAVWPIATRPFKEAHFATFPPDLAERCILAGCPHGGLVLDPFGGAGTTALAALRHGRRAALIELNPEYAAIARTRIESEWMGEDERRRARMARDVPASLGSLFDGIAEAAE
ncbi:DNA methylase [Azorhizobium sp. AG788]|uniref:DNA-methyltransferase n=1 Tax=Azorhizobium sp. AG788 TaxID=2183897 RepID=UPI00105D5A9D|nr:site-specific DNA-methyltransferase [Azorhizobium sp. AG788]TDT94906.1 DNA methylase [Azorhizobium sp. AG788]